MKVAVESASSLSKEEGFIFDVQMKGFSTIRGLQIRVAIECSDSYGPEKSQKAPPENYAYSLETFAGCHF